jgi:hypothetical protein
MIEPIEWRGYTLHPKRGVTCDTVWCFIDTPNFIRPLSAAHVWKAKTRWHAWVCNGDYIFNGKTPQAALDAALRYWIKRRVARIESHEKALVDAKENLVQITAIMGAGLRVEGVKDGQ